MTTLPLRTSGTSLHPLEDTDGPPLLAIGFRPFFLCASLSVVGLVPLWLILLGTSAITPPYLTGVRFHTHEMLFGYTCAVVAGFLLTAASNWTGRRIATGGHLVGLVVLWGLGRFAPWTLPPIVAAVVDVTFLPALMISVGRVLIKSGNKRNWIFLGMLGLLTAANVLFHLETLGWSWTPGSLGGKAEGEVWVVLALRVITLMMLVIGGRVIPMFTRNGTQTPWVRAIPELEFACLGTFLLAAVLELLPVPSQVNACLWLLAGLLALVRMIPWGPWRAKAPLLWILHVGAACVALSFVFKGLALLGGVPVSTATHLLTVGGIGGLTLGMMTRVSLGHSGRMLVAPRAMVGSFSLLVAATLLRAGGPWVLPHHTPLLWQLSGAAFVAAFCLMLRFGWPIWTTPRVA